MSLLFTGEVPIPDIKGAVDRASGVLKDYSALKVAEGKAKAAAYKRLEARENSLRKQIFGSSEIGKIPAAIRPAAIDGLSVMIDKAVNELGIEGGVEAGQTIAHMLGWIQDLVPNDTSSFRNLVVDGIGNPTTDHDSVMVNEYTEDFLKEQDEIYNLIGATGEVVFGPDGAPTMMVTMPGATEAVPHGQTEAYAQTGPYQVIPTLLAPKSDLQYAKQYLGLYQQNATEFNPAVFDSDFRQLFMREDGGLRTEDNINFSGDSGYDFWRLTNELSDLGVEKGLTPIPKNTASWQALSSGDPDHPINKGAYAALHETAVQNVTDAVRPVARQQFRTKTTKAETKASTIELNRQSLLSSIGDAPKQITFVDEQGDARKLWANSYPSDKLGMIDNLSVDNSEEMEKWEGERQTFIEKGIADKQTKYPEDYLDMDGDSEAVSKTKEANRGNQTNYLERKFDEANPMPVDEIKLSKVQVLYKAWDPVTEEFRMFVSAPKTGTKVGGAVSQAEYYLLPKSGRLSKSYDLVNSALRDSFNLSGGFLDDALPGARDYAPPTSSLTYAQWKANQPEGADTSYPAFNAAKN